MGGANWGGSQGISQSWNNARGQNSSLSTSGSSSQSGPWGAQSPYLQSTFDEASKLYGSGPQSYYPESGVNPLNALQDRAINARFDRGVTGSPQEAALGQTLLGALGSPGPDTSGSDTSLRGFEGAGLAGAGALAGTVLGGGGNNPHLDSTYDAAAGRIGRNFRDYALPGINSTFGGGGRTGSQAHRRAVGDASRGLGENLSDLGANIYGRAYESDANRRLSAGQSLLGAGAGAAGTRGSQAIQGYGAQTNRQLGAGGLVPQHSGLEVQNINLQQEAGDRLRGQDDMSLQDRINRFYFDQDAPQQALSQYRQNLGAPIQTSGSESGSRSASQGSNQSSGGSKARNQATSKGFNLLPW